MSSNPLVFMSGDRVQYIRSNGKLVHATVVEGNDGEKTYVKIKYDHLGVPHRSRVLPYKLVRVRQVGDLSGDAA
jgi:hypothetical protein